MCYMLAVFLGLWLRTTTMSALLVVMVSIVPDHPVQVLFS